MLEERTHLFKGFYCLGKGVSGSSHTIGVKEHSHLSILPGVVPLGVLLRCGSPEEAGADDKLMPPEKAGRAASRLPCGFLHRSRSIIGKLAFTPQISQGQEWEVGLGIRPAGCLPCLTHGRRVSFLRVGITVLQGTTLTLYLNLKPSGDRLLSWGCCFCCWTAGALFCQPHLLAGPRPFPDFKVSSDFPEKGMCLWAPCFLIAGEAALAI